MRSTIDSEGRIVIPEPLLNQAGLLPGTEVEISLRDGHLEITSIAEMTAEITVEQRGRFLVAVAPPQAIRRNLKTPSPLLPIT